MNLPRIMLAAPSSGSGKTLITAGLLKLLKTRGFNIRAFKCGPDYIDPMFHSRALEIKSSNLDSFFTEPEILRALLAQGSSGADMAVIEGVMGYYDGISGFSDRASSYEVAKITKTPVILTVNCRGMSLSVIPYIKGFLEYKKESCIEGVILNNLSPMLYKSMKRKIEEELPIKVCGFVPRLDFTLESRRLGLVMPDEIADIENRLSALSEVLSESLETDEIIRIAKSAQDISDGRETLRAFELPQIKAAASKRPLKIGLADDEAFCFFYEDNLSFLRKNGCEIARFSPIHDSRLPEGICGLYLCGGYPELYAKQLSKNSEMRRQIKEAAKGGMPILAECGGFMYLHESLQSDDGKFYPMAGAVKGRAYKKDKLERFGYITLSGGTVFGADTGDIPSHEFHYYDSDDAGDAFLAKKPLSGRFWRCMHSSDTLFAGYPHMYFYANKRVPEAFLAAALRRMNEG